MKEKSKEKDNIKKDNKSRKVEETPKHYKDGEFKKVEKKEVKENKLNKVILTILLILVILVIAIGIIYGGRIINKAKLDKELENLVSKDVSVEEIENTETITSGDFATVEEIVKASGIDFDTKPYYEYDFAFLMNYLYSRYSSFMTDASYFVKIVKATLENPLVDNADDTAYHMAKELK